MPTMRRVAEAELGQLVADLVGQRPRARDEADRALAEDLGRDDPRVRLAGREHAGAVRADQRHAARAQVRGEAEHVVRRDVLGDADRGRDAGVGRLVDGVGREARRDEDERRVRAGRGDGGGDRVEHRDAVDVLAALSRRDAGDDVRAVVAVAQAEEAALAAGQALDERAACRGRRGSPLRPACARSAIRSITRSAPRIRSTSSSRTRRASSPVHPVRSSHASSSIGWSKRRHLLDGEARGGEEPAPLLLGVVADVRRVAELLGLLEGLAAVRGVDDDHAPARDARQLGARPRRRRRSGAPRRA